MIKKMLYFILSLFIEEDRELSCFSKQRSNNGYFSYSQEKYVKIAIEKAVERNKLDMKYVNVQLAEDVNKIVALFC